MPSTRKLLAQLIDPKCTQCKLHQEAVQVCQAGHGSSKAKIMVVGRMPNSDQWQEDLNEELAEVGLEPQDLWFTSALKCRNFEQSASSLDVKTCRDYLEKEIAALQPKWILALGNEALLATTGHSGIMKWRGRVVDRGDYKVFPTISPASVQRNPGQRQGYMADLRLFVAQVLDKATTVPKPKVVVVDNAAKIHRLRDCLAKAEVMTYDIETRGRDEFVPDGCIVSLALTLKIGDKLKCFAIPLAHPESPWFRQWRSLLKHLSPHLARVPKHIAHNGKFDARWLRRHGVRVRVEMDTMLGAHVLDENRQKGLKPQAASRLGVAPWAIETKDLWSQPLDLVLEYNALDTWYTYHIYLDMREDFRQQPRLAKLYKLVTVPANSIYIEAEGRGVWMDRRRLAERRKIALDQVAHVEEQLMEWVPSLEEIGAIDGEAAIAEVGWPTYKSGKLVGVNFNPSIFSRWLLFEHLGLPVLERGKQKPDGRPGDPSMREGVMLELKDRHPIIPLLLQRGNKVKLAQFMETYDAVLDLDDRIHTTFKLAGTVTGRTSSGKADEEKISGRAGDQRGVNLQQVPRDPFVRGLFGAAPGYTFLEADFSQVELRIAGFLSRDPTMLRLFQTGQDIHTATASSVLGVPPSKVTKDHRKKAKPVNFGFLYGMGAPKFVRYAFENYGVHFTLEEAQEVRKAYFAQFSSLQAWHAKQRRLVHKYGRVMSPIGRIRHLPDIRSGDPNVVAEAERQAINSPVQSFGSDMMLIAMQLMVKEFARRELEAYVLGTVQDAVLLEVADDQVAKVARIVKSCMEDLLLQVLSEWFDVDLDVPIVADLKCGGYWGDALEIPAEAWTTKKTLQSWLDRTKNGRIELARAA